MSDLAHQLRIPPRFGTTSRALVVDGHATARNILVNQLRSLGVGQILQCGTASEARRQMAAQGVDVLLCEHRLECGTQGAALIDELRRDQRLSLNTVVIMVSAEASYRVVAEVAESALDGFLIKPYAAGKLEDRLIAAFQRKDSLRPIIDAIEAERYEAALAICEACFSKRGRYWTHAARLGAELALRLSRVPLASAMFAAVLADKTVPWAKLGLARALDASGQSGAAVSTIRNLLSDEPSYADAYDVMGRICADQGDFAGAINAFRQASEITPFSVVRVQKYGILAYHAGDLAQALPALQQAARLGVESPAFDHQTLLLLAMAHHQAGDGVGLRTCREQLEAAVARLGVKPVADPRGDRLQRMGLMARTLMALHERDQSALHSGLSQLASGLHAPDFDVEAATNLLSLIASSDAAGQAQEQAAPWVRRAGLRFCVSKQATEVLAKACEPAPELSGLVRTAHAEISELSRTALSEGLSGDHRRAVEELLAAVERTRNAKLLDMARAALDLHRAQIDNFEALLQRCDELRESCGQTNRTPLRADDPDRPAGGLALGRIGGTPEEPVSGA